MAETELQTLLAVMVIGGLVAGVIASSRGLTFTGFFVLGAMLPIIGILFALVAKAPGPLARLTPAAGKGWWDDPTGRFEHRWFDGRHWTQHVGRAGAQYEDVL